MIKITDKSFCQGLSYFAMHFIKRDTNDVNIARRLGDSLTACVTTAPAPIKRVSPVESNYFLASDNNDQEIDPSDLLDHWLRELDSAKMVGANWILKLVNFHFIYISRM